MKLGLYFDLRNPAAWRRPWRDHYARTLEWIEGAEAAGAESIWVTEHHGFEDGYLPQPLTFAAAIAARTRRVRIGTAVVLAPLHPSIAIAEQAAVVDLISGGRLELGLGAGYVRSEFEAYRADRERRFGLLEERIREIPALWAEGRATPAPVQQPLPIWGGVLGPQGAQRVGRLGAGLLNIDRDQFALYAKAFDEAGHGAARPRCGGMIDLLLADDPDEAYERVLPHRLHMMNSYRVATYAGSGKEPKLLTLDALRKGSRTTGFGDFAVLTVDEAAARIRARCEGLPVEHVYLWASFAGMPDELVERQIELVSGPLREVLRGR